MEINYSHIFLNLDTFTGLPLTLKGRRWFGKCYIDGTLHHRWDKTTCYMYDDKIYIIENGGDKLSLWDWMLRYGGCNNNSDVAKKLSEESSVIIMSPIREFKEPPLKYVYPNVLENTMRCYSDNLFLWLITHFSESEVLSVYRKYKVGNLNSKRGILTIFWYVDKNDKVCFDKKMLYKEDGHRNKDYGGGRKYKVDDGFRGKCYFGEHLLKDRDGKRIFLVESEKTAIILSLKYPKNIYLATGGVNGLREIEEDWILLRDYDKAGEMWESRGNCVKWWEKYSKVEEGWDIGDSIICEMEKEKIIKKMFL